MSQTERRHELLLLIVLYTEVDAQCDKLHGQAGQSDVDRRKFWQLSSTENGPVYHTGKTLRCSTCRGEKVRNSKVPEKVPLPLEIPEYHYNTV